MPFAPELVVPAILDMHTRYGQHIYSKYGFVDAFNRTSTSTSRCGTAATSRASAGSAGDYLGIDQGPILAMIENYRSGSSGA